MTSQECVEKTTQMVIRKIIYKDTKLIKTDQLIYDTIEKTIEMIHKKEESKMSYIDRINQELLIYLQHCKDCETNPEPVIWLNELHETLLFKLERRVGWLPLINQIFITQCVLQVVDSYCNGQVLNFDFDSEFPLHFRYALEDSFSTYVFQQYSEFILSLGGWSDITDYFDSIKSTPKLRTKFHAALTLSLLLLLFLLNKQP